jgi:type II secretion system protein D
MGYVWVVWMAAALGQTTQPAEAEISHAPTTQPAVEVRVEAPDAEPGDIDVTLDQLFSALDGDRASLDAGFDLGELTGPVEIDVTADGSIILYGDERDVAIIEEFIRMLDEEPIFRPEFRIVHLQSADAVDLAQRVQQFWERARQPVRVPLRPEERITIIPEARANLLLIAASKENMEMIVDIVRELDRPALGELVTFESIQLEHIRAVEAEAILNDMLQSLMQRRGAQRDLVTIQANPRLNMLLINAPPEDLAQIREWIRLIDVEPRAETGGIVSMAFFPLERARASDVASALTDMLRPDTDIARALQEQVRRLRTVKRLPDGTEQELSELNLEKPIKVIAEPGSNAIIVATVEENLQPVGEIIALLDSVPLAGEVVVNIFPLDHADAELLAGQLEDVFRQGPDLMEQPGKPEIRGRIPPGLTGEALAYPIGITADRRTNTVIVSGRAEQLLLVKQIVKAVDVTPEIGLFAPRLVQLENASVVAIAEVVREIADQRQTVLEQTAGATAAERLRTLIIPDVRTNSLVIVATDENYQEIAGLAQQLDGVEEDWLGQIRIINLTNLTATSLASQIEDLWERRARLRREGGLPEDQPVIVADTRSNSLVIASQPSDYEAILRLVNQLEEQELAPMADIRLITLEHNDPGELGSMLQQLWEARLAQSLAEGQVEQPVDRVTIVDDAMTRTLLVVSSKSNFEEIQKLVTQLDVPPVVEGLYRIFFVRNADITKAADLLRELFSEGLYLGRADTQTLPEWATRVTVVPDLRSSALIVSASPQNMTIIESLLKDIDREDIPALPTGARFFVIQHADVVQVADTLEQMLEGMQQSMAAEQRDQLEARIIPDSRTRTLIVTGARFALRRAEELVPQLDRESPGAAYEMKIYSLEQASASKLEPIMTDLFERRMTQDQAGQRTPIHIVADDASNNLIVTASLDDHKMVQHLVGLLDRSSTIAQQMHVIRLEHAKADTMADMIGRLIEEQQRDATGGFTIVPEPRTNSLLVWASPDLLRNIRTIATELDNTRPKAEMGMRVFKLRNARAEDLAQLLDDFFERAGAGTRDDVRQMIINFGVRDPFTGEQVPMTLVHQDITISPDPHTNSLMVLAPDKHIHMVGMMVEMLDSVEPVTADLRIFPLRNADATRMARLLEELFQTGRAADGRPQLVFAGAEAGTVPAGPGVIELAFSVDERTNSLIAAGSPSYLKIVERLVFELDRVEMEERIARVVHLRNRQPDVVATAMRAYFEEEQRALREVAEGEAALRQLQRMVVIEPGGEGSSALLLRYNPRMEAEVINVLNELDRAPAMVMIQVLIAEVTLDDRFELGMEFALQDLSFSKRAVEGPPGIITGPGHDVILGTDIGGATSETGLGGFTFTVTSEDFNFLFRALQVEGRLEVLSRPAIMVQDNQEAAITIGERVPTVQNVVVSAAGVITPSVTYEKVGVILNVTPIVNPDGFVSMQIAPEISSIGVSSISIGGGVTLPTFTERSAETTVNVKDGETIIIGGLITSRENRSESKAPLLGDLPLLGNLFRAKVDTTTRTELLFVLTPHVVRTPEDQRRLSIEMRDQSGLLDNVRKSPLMGNLQVRPEEEPFAPVEMLEPIEERPRIEGPAPMGPEIEELGPPLSMIEIVRPGRENQGDAPAETFRLEVSAPDSP